jgi:hypothetical protein
MTAPNAAVAAGFGDRPPPRRMRLISFRPLLKGSLRGFANVELPNGLKIIDCPVMTSHGKAWATLPSKPVLDREGKQVLVDGKKQYAALLEWRDRDLSNGFSAAVVELIREKHPEAFEEKAA